MFPDITQYLWSVWLVLAVGFVVLELFTLNLLFLMMAAGSLIGGLGGWALGLPWYGQVLAAAVLSSAFVFLVRPLLWHRLLRSREVVRTNVDALSGMEARATVAFRDGSGMARLANGETWTARLAPTHARDAVPPGERLTVTWIDGATAVVVPAADPVSPRGERSSS